MNMSTMKIRLATPAEKAAYNATNPVYPLHGFVTVSTTDGRSLPVAVEDLRCWSRPDPQWEAVAPKGYRFELEDTHTLLGHTQRDLLERLSFVRLEPCPTHCGCTEEEV